MRGNVLMHFRTILRGFLPIQLAWDGKIEELRNREGVDYQSVRYLTKRVHALDYGKPIRTAGIPITDN